MLLDTVVELKHVLPYRCLLSPAPGREPTFICLYFAQWLQSIENKKLMAMVVISNSNKNIVLFCCNSMFCILNIFLQSFCFLQKNTKAFHNYAVISNLNNENQDFLYFWPIWLRKSWVMSSQISLLICSFPLSFVVSQSQFKVFCF